MFLAWSSVQRVMPVYDCGGGGEGETLLWGATGWPDHARTSPFSTEISFFQKVFAEKPTPFGCIRALV